MSEEEICSQFIRLLRLQRNDFINHLQVVHALIQLGRGEKALRYIEEVSKKIESVDESLYQYQEQAVK
ncbi:MAG: hypothetical protein H6Q65_1906 [Firmicutes bacterium]|nr:hypothetical protein [Bacillota bacterium]